MFDNTRILMCAHCIKPDCCKLAFVTSDKVHWMCAIGWDFWLSTCCVTTDFAEYTFNLNKKNYIYLYIYNNIELRVIPGVTSAATESLFFELAASRFLWRARRCFSRYSALFSSLIRAYQPWPLGFFWAGRVTSENSAIFVCGVPPLSLCPVTTTSHTTHESRTE